MSYLIRKCSPEDATPNRSAKFSSQPHANVHCEMNYSRSAEKFLEVSGVVVGFFVGELLVTLRLRPRMKQHVKPDMKSAAAIPLSQMLAEFVAAVRFFHPAAPGGR